MSRHNHRNGQSNTKYHRSDPTGKCAFTGKRELLSQMIRSDKVDPDGPLYFSSANALAMYKHVNGIAPIISGDVEEAHNHYMDTLKKCYPRLYNAQFGYEKEKSYQCADWNDNNNNDNDNDNDNDFDFDFDLRSNNIDNE
jgi:hypothetical protein